MIFGICYVLFDTCYYNCLQKMLHVGLELPDVLLACVVGGILEFLEQLEAREDGRPHVVHVINGSHNANREVVHIIIIWFGEPFKINGGRRRHAYHELPGR